MLNLLCDQEVDLACAPYTATLKRPYMELAVYVLGDDFSILTKYPTPETSIYGIFMTFSLNVGT